MKNLLLTLLVFSMISLSAFAKDRFALVIGNSDYKVDPLSNPVYDARDMAQVLGELGFDVMLRVNADQMTMESAIEAFGNKLHKNAVGLFYFSGHGAQYAGENYLIPINSIHRTMAAQHLRYKAVPAGYVLGTMQAADNGLNIVILDACRDNPFKGFSRSLRKGLTKMKGAEGSLIAYATAPGTVAWDGGAGERNSPYTKHLLRFIKQPNLSIESMLKKVRRAVIKETHNEPTVQKPWYEASISDEFYFVEKPQISTQPQPMITPSTPATSSTTGNYNYRIHTVQTGDSLYGIAKQYGKTVREVAAWNGLEPPYSLDIGQKLKVSPPTNTSNKSYRYTDNGDGTVTDNRSGLIWLKNANCFGRQNWETAMQSAANLASGQCGLRDGSRRGMWRLPSTKEWETIIDEKYVVNWENRRQPIWGQPMLSNATGTGPWMEGDAFSGIQTDGYWSSTYYPNMTEVWVVSLVDGTSLFHNNKTRSNYVWPVRGKH